MILRVATPDRGGSTAMGSSASPAHLSQHGVDPLDSGGHHRQAVAPAALRKDVPDGIGVARRHLKHLGHVGHGL